MRGHARLFTKLKTTGKSLLTNAQSRIAFATSLNVEALHCAERVTCKRTEQLGLQQEQARKGYPKDTVGDAPASPSDESHLSS